MSTHNICFRGEIRKILCGYPLLSVAMISVCASKQSDQSLLSPWRNFASMAIQNVPREECTG